jgi:DNA (cytosine-5)-methyltransferase 1
MSLERKTFASLFTGGGLADVGAIAAGLEPVWGVEIQPEIAEVARHNLKHKVRVADLLDCDPSQFERTDVLWASPPCPNFSIAKQGAKETALDRAIASKVAEFITVLQPDSFVLENVEAYKSSSSLREIENTLYTLGYWISRRVLNAADFGVPQTRRRLILRAVKGGMPLELGRAAKWKSWYSAIEDLLPDLPESKLAEWQINSLPFDTLLISGTERRSPKALLINRSQTERRDYWRDSDRPAYTVCAESSAGRSRALLIDGIANGYGKTVTCVDADRPSFTVKTSASKHCIRAVLDSARVVKINARALGRFQSLPDWYELPSKEALACRIIGNGVPCDFSEGILLSV